MPLIFISSPVHPAIVDAARQFARVALGYGPDALAYDDIATDVDAVLLRSGQFSDPMMAGSPGLRIIARHGVGTDSVDIPAASRRGIWVTNTPGRNSRAVAEHVFALILGLARKLAEAAARTRSGHWSEDRARLDGIELEGRTLGLLGQGSIGQIVARIGTGFGMKVITCDPALDQDMPDVVGLAELLRRSDVISLHLPLLPETRRIIDADAISRMKDGALLINTARGGLVDEAALTEALRSGKLGGAGLDVLDAENLDMISPMAHNRLPIAEFPNLLVTPHIGGQTNESLLRVGQAALDDIRAVLNGEVPGFAVNRPDLAARSDV
ncbi:MAG: hydroxyacid dehydrogenase [Paracoccus sp. (in: a-proteobacteria)]|nr:hydroxyacid dehydrogenase [Paracoccus sp. (in: a-proteobacteria)]